MGQCLRPWPFVAMPEAPRILKIINGPFRGRTTPCSLGTWHSSVPLAVWCMKVSAQSGAFAVWFSVSTFYFPKIFFCEVHLVISRPVCQDCWLWKWHRRIKCISVWKLPVGFACCQGQARGERSQRTGCHKRLRFFGSLCSYCFSLHCHLS